MLPDELIVEILLRLPVRSLLQFRRVCSSWKTLISSPQFGKDHLQRSTANPALTHPQLLYSTHCSDCEIGFCSMNSLSDNTAPKKVATMERQYTDVLGSCNGLLCLYASLHNSFMLWNPATGSTSEPVEIEASTERCVTYHGFGYDHVHDKYKLLVVVEDCGSKPVTKVYTFGSNTWTTIQHFPFAPGHMRAKFVSGALVWLATVDRCVIFSLDLRELTYDLLRMPDWDGRDGIGEYEIYKPRPLLCVSMNCLFLCFEYFNRNWVVWMMEEDHSWTKLGAFNPFGRLSHTLLPSGNNNFHIGINDTPASPPPPMLVALYDSHVWRSFGVNCRGHYCLVCSRFIHRFGQRYFHIHYESLLSPSQL